jgi:NADH-quinone oxidoreductase subunit N
MSWIAAAGFGLSLVAAAYYLRIAYVLFAPAKKTCECECSCKCADNAVFGYMLKFTVAAAAVALLVVGVFPSLALL